MSSNPSDTSAPKGGGLWARLFGLEPPPSPEQEEAKNDAAPPPELALGEPSTAPEELALAEPPAPAPEAAEASPPLAMAISVAVEIPAAGPEQPLDALEVKEEPAPPPSPPAPPQLCPSCQTPRKGTQPFCEDCGWMFGPNDPLPASNGPLPTPAASNPAPVNRPALGTRLKERYEIQEQLSERSGVFRYRGLDHGSTPPLPVVLVQAAALEVAPLANADGDVPEAEVEEAGEDEFLPTFEMPPGELPVASVEAPWPSIAWEKALLEKVDHPALPRILDSFVEGGQEYLVEELPEGRVLWDAWDDPDTNARARYGSLKQLAEGLHALHKAGAICESLRPDIVTVTEAGQVMLADLGELLPLPLPPGTPIRASLYTAPELVLTPEKVDARADLYSFGGLIYSLEYLHHALEEKDFEHQFSPRLITDRYPDVHPGFFRLVCKTFCRDVNTRLPTDEASREDASGFTELIRTLDVCARTFDKVRFDIAAWTTTGMVRTGNEDAFAVLHGIESRQDELTEYAMVLLCDGMGGYEAGEVAAALAIASMRKYLLGEPMFAALGGNEPPAAQAFDVNACKKVLEAALRHANKEVYTAARTPGKGRRGMGTTAECIYVDQYNVIVGHVGDSRVYHLHEGRLKQLTRDQTLVNRLVELGQLTEAEAEHHPRKNELQQAIGGQPDVVPGTYSGKLKRGDWILVCSDGLSNHIPVDDLEKMMLREAAGSAEEAARRLMNLVNLRGATDNATIVVIRAM
jgi:PPM family protein phosphatase